MFYDYFPFPVSVGTLYLVIATSYMLLRSQFSLFNNEKAKYLIYEFDISVFNLVIK